MIEITNRKELMIPFYTYYVVPDVTTDDEPCYMAYNLELDGCMSQGDTPEEALQNLAEVTQLYLSSLENVGIESSKPQNMKRGWYDILDINTTQGPEEMPIKMQIPWLVGEISQSFV